MSAAALVADAGMQVEFSPAERRAREEFRSFTHEHVRPHAAAWDRASRISPEVVEALRGRGWLGAPLPAEVGGQGMDPVTYGLLTQELARGCSSVRSLLTVHDMVAVGFQRWGSRELRAELLPRIARGELLCAFALSEPEVGSDAASVQARARREGDDYVIDGCKRWITFGLLADLILVLARLDDHLTAFLVPADTPGLERRPLDVVGTRAAMLAELRFEGCRVPARYMVGKPGFGLSHVGATVLDQGRYSVAWGAVGIVQACLDACLEYTRTRRQFGEELRHHQLVRAMLTEMIASTHAARLMCCRAGHLRRVADPGATTETLLAKYFASRAAVRAAGDAVQLHGANGLSAEYPLERLMRDARVTEIIEGSTQIQQIIIARNPPAEL